MTAPDDKEVARRVRELLDRGDGKKAYSLCRQEFGRRQAAPAEILLYAEALFATGRLAEAEDLLRELIRRQGMDATTALGLADILGRTGRSDEALVLLREQEQRHPDELAAPLALGVIFSRMAREEQDPGRRRQRWNEAEESYRRAQEKGGWHEAIATGLAALDVLRQRPARARAILENALQTLREPRSRQFVLADLLLYQVMWGEQEAAEQVAARLGHEANRDPASFAPVLLNLAAQARQMAEGDEQWRARALLLADILEGLRGGP
jgi:Flp pilus assembly protein TadD